MRSQEKAPGALWEDLLVCEWTESESHSVHFQRCGDLDLLGASSLRSLGLGQTWNNGIFFLFLGSWRLKPQEYIADLVCCLHHGEEPTLPAYNQHRVHSSPGMRPRFLSLTLKALFFPVLSCFQSQGWRLTLPLLLSTSLPLLSWFLSRHALPLACFPT